MNEKLTPTKGILYNPLAGDSYSLKRYNPPKDLAHFVEHYWVVRWNLPAGQQYQPEILPDPSVNMTITANACEVSGVVTGKFSYTLEGSGVILGVKFLPGGFYPFLRQPLDHLTNTTLPVRGIFGGTRTKRLVATLDQTDELMIVELEKLLRAKKPKVDGTVAAVNDVVKAIIADKTITQVQTVAEAFDTSERTMQHVFQKYVGVGVKWIISRYRVQDVADAIDHGATNWVELADDYGFSDQSHFIRDFKKVVGETPAQYSKRQQTTPPTTS